MLDERFVILGALLSLIGGLSYVIDTIKGKAKPNRVTWFIWALAPLIAFSAEINQGVGLQSLLTFSMGFIPLLVFLASFLNKNAHWDLGRLDLVCGGLALLGVVLWRVTNVGDLAILLSIAADAIAAIPTVIKAYRDPSSENYKMFFYGAINAAITLLVIKQWNIAYFGFPVYIFALYTLLTFLVFSHIGDKARSKPPMITNR